MQANISLIKEIIILKSTQLGNDLQGSWEETVKCCRSTVWYFVSGESR